MLQRAIIPKNKFVETYFKRLHKFHNIKLGPCQYKRSRKLLTQYAQKLAVQDELKSRQM